MRLIKEGLRLAGFGNAVQALGSPNYRHYVVGNGVSQCGTWMKRVAIGWLTWQLTHSGTWLGIIASVDLVTIAFIGPVAGALADRLELLRTARFVQIAAALQSIALAVLIAFDIADIWTLFSLTLVQGIINAVDGPTRLALVPNLVERPILSSALAINSVVFNLARFIGPIAAGLAIDHVGVPLAFALNAATYLWFYAALLTVRVEREERPSSERGLLRAMVEGVSYAVKHPGIGPILLLLTVTAIGQRGVMDLLPGFADAVFSRGAQGLSWLIAVIGVGAMLGGLWMIRRGAAQGLPGVAISSLLWCGVALAAFAATKLFWLGLICLFVAGFCMTLTGISCQTLLQTAVDPAMRGRVMSLYGIIFRGAPSIGTFLMGFISGPLGLQWPVIGAAVLTALYWAWARLDLARVTQELEDENSAAE